MKIFREIEFDKKEGKRSVTYEEGRVVVSCYIDSLDFSTLKELGVQNEEILKYSSQFKVKNWSGLENLLVSIKDLPKEKRIKFITYLDIKELFQTACDFSYFIHKVYKIDIAPEEIVKHQAELEKQNKKVPQNKIIEKIVENNKSNENKGSNEDFKLKNKFKRDKIKKNKLKNNERTK